jgi:hypothetical protein
MMKMPSTGLLSGLLHGPRPARSGSRPDRRAESNRGRPLDRGRGVGKRSGRHRVRCIQETVRCQGLPLGAGGRALLNLYKDGRARFPRQVHDSKNRDPLLFGGPKGHALHPTLVVGGNDRAPYALLRHEPGITLAHENGGRGLRGLATRRWPAGDLPTGGWRRAGAPQRAERDARDERLVREDAGGFRRQDPPGANPSLSRGHRHRADPIAPAPCSEHALRLAHG